MAGGATAGKADLRTAGHAVTVTTGNAAGDEARAGSAGERTSRWSADLWLRQADSLSILYTEGLYRDPGLADAFIHVHAALHKAFAKPRRLASAEAAWTMALAILERLPADEDWQATAAYVSRQMESLQPEKSDRLQVDLWGLMYRKDLLGLNAYRQRLRAMMDHPAADAAAAGLALATTYRYTCPDTAHVYARLAAGRTPADTATAEALQALLKSLEAPFFSISGLPVYAPGAPMLWSVCVKNIRRLPYQVFQIPADDRLNFLGGMMPFKRYVTDKTPLVEAAWTLDGLPQDYGEHRTEVGLAPLPAGTYLLAVDHKIFIPFQVSALMLIDLGPAGFIAHRRQGHPMPGVQAEILTAEYDYVRHLNRYERLYGPYLSDRDGFVALDDTATPGTDTEARPVKSLEPRQSRFYLFHLGHDSLIRTFVQPPVVLQETPDGAIPDDTAVSLRFFTDLPLYRAGDSLRFKGVAWARRAGNGATFPLPARELEVFLIAPDPLGRRSRQQTSSESQPSFYVTTDSLGGFSGGFHLPAEATAGLWRLRARLTSPSPRPHQRQDTAQPAGHCHITDVDNHYVRVEAYRPPQFEIRLENRDSAVWGRVTTMNGQPLSGGIARIEVRLTENRWRPAGTKPEPGLWQAALQLDENGCFLLPVGQFAHLEHQSAAPDADGPGPLYGHYDFRCTVLDLNGEIQQASLWLPLLQTPFHTRLTAFSGATGHLPDTLRFQVFNPQGESRPADYRLTVERLTDTLPDPPFNRRFPEPDHFLWPLDTFLNNFPDEPYHTQAMRQAALLRHKVLSHSGRDSLLIVNLPEGTYAYRALIQPLAFPGRTDTCEGIFSMGEADVLPTLYAEADGSTLRLRWKQPDTGPRTAPRPDSIFVFYSVEARHQPARQGCLSLPADRPVSDTSLSLAQFGADADLNILLSYVYGQRLFRQYRHRAGLVSDTALRVHVRHLPDSGHTLAADSLCLHFTLNGRGQAVPVTVALYDDALHALAPEGWFNVLPPRLAPPPAPVPFLRRHAYDPTLFAQSEVYTSPDAYLFDRLQNERALAGGLNAMGRPAYAPMAKAALTTERGAGTEEAADAAGSTGFAADPADDRLQARGEQPPAVLFHPTLWTDAEGYLQLPLHLPAAPGRYRWAVMAYDHHLRTAYLSAPTATYRDYQLSWKLPSFLYAGDSVLLSAKASRRDATAAQTAVVTWDMAGRRFENRVDWPAGQADLKLTAPDFYRPADSGALTVRLELRVDGHAAAEATAGDALMARIPVLSDRIRLQYSIPFYLRPGEIRTIRLSKSLKQALRQSPAIDTLFSWAANPAERLALLGQALTLDTAAHAWNALLHYLKNHLYQAHADRKISAANTPVQAAYRQLCRFLTPDDGFCWIEGQPTDPRITFAITEALAANTGDVYDVDRLLKRQLLPYLSQQPAYRTDTTAERPSSDRLRFLYANALVYGVAADRYDRHAMRDLQRFAAQPAAYPVREGIYGLYALQLQGQDSLCAAVWRYYRQAARQDADAGLYWRPNDMGGYAGERLRTAALVYRFLRSLSDRARGMGAHRAETAEAAEAMRVAEASLADAAAVSAWIGRQHRTTDLLSPAVDVRPMDILTLAYNERLFPQPTLPAILPVWQLKGRTLTIDWRTANDTTANPGATSSKTASTKPDTSPFGAYGALTFGYTRTLSAVAAAPGSDLRVELISPSGVTQGDSPVLQLRIESKHPASYVQVRFGRPAGGSYADTRAGFVHKRGLSFYENIGETGTELLIPYLPAGRYLLSYPLQAETVGAFTLPPATIELLLDTADSFSSHSAARAIRIQAK